MSAGSGETIDRMLADAVFLMKLQPEVDADYDGDEMAVLFATIARGLATYVRGWHERGTGAGMATLLVDSRDLADPARASDPRAVVRDLLDMALEAIEDNAVVLLDLEAVSS